MAGGQNSNKGNTRDVKGLPRNRPWLLPSNRKLRHLQGLSVRNLDLKPPTLPRGKTIDDESLPHTLKTPAKALVQREIATLGHSKSHGDLQQKAKEDHEQDTKSRDKGKQNGSIGEAQQRPLANKLRRRSTLNWTNTSQRERQNALEEITRTRMADIWFSLLIEDAEEPIYISEVLERTVNPSFRAFDLNTYGAAVTRRNKLTIQFWTRTEGVEDYSLFVELTVSLRALQYIGKTLEDYQHALPRNAVIFHMSDGVYTSFTDLPPEDTASVAAASLTSNISSRIETTSSFDALMQLSNLDNCIQDALTTRGNLARQIDALLEEQRDAQSALDAVPQGEDYLASINRSVAACRRQVQAAQRRRTHLQDSLKTRRMAIKTGQETEKRASGELISSRKELSTRKQGLQTIKHDLSGQIRRIGEELSGIYPIDPASDGSLTFTIRGLDLPVASSLIEKDPSIISAALSHAAHVTYLLSLYLSIPIPYPITLHGSSSTITDPISATMPSAASRIFPLHQKGAVTYRFEYGVFLLNTNIELLMSRQGARMMDLRYTLGNLKYILMVITEGKGEIPGRKRGQIRALNGSVKGSSRSSSILSGRAEKRSPLGRAFEASELRKALDDTRPRT